MALSENAFFQYKETRALSGYKSAWLYYDNDIQKYRLIGLTETAPYVFGGDNDSFEYDILQAETKGLVQGKPTVETKTVEVLHHRDNVYRFEKLKGKTISFMTINGEFVGYKYEGTLDYRPNDAEADVNRATVTITPMNANSTPIYNARDDVAETLCFAHPVDATVKVGQIFDLSVKQDVSTISYQMMKIAKDGKESEATSKLTSTDPSKSSISEAGLFAIKAYDTAGIFASWTTTVYVESAT